MNCKIYKLEEILKMKSLKELLSTIAPVNLSIEAKPLSSYTNMVVQKIDIFISQLSVNALHKEKFAQTAKYLQVIKKYILENQSMPISISFAKHIANFSAELAKLNDLSSQCTEYYSNRTINETSLIEIWENFLLFWLSSLKFIRFFDQAQFFDPLPLCVANQSDLKIIRDNYHPRQQQRVQELQNMLANNPSDLNLCLIKLVGFSTKTPFSLCFKVSMQNRFFQLEIFNPEVQANLFFRKYISILSQMVHPNISPFYGSTNTLPYSVLSPHCENGTLASKLHKQVDGLSPTQLSIIMLDVARALEYLHSKKVVHRFLKPENIFLNESNNAIVGGLWNSCHEPTIEKQIPFSPYCAPELLLDPEFYNEKSDVYSFTILVWEMYMNMVPFAEKTTYAAKNDIIYQDLRPKLPSDTSIVNFFICGWLRNPNNRPTMSEVVRAIENQEILIPETDVEQFSTYVESTRRSHTAALKGILLLKIDQLKQLETKEVLDESSIELLTNVVYDSQDEQLRTYAQQLLVKNLDRNTNFSLKSLVLYCQLSLLVKEIQPRVLSMCKAIPNRDELIKSLLASIDTAQAVEFMIVFGLQNENDCNLLLDTAANQTPAIAEKAARASIAALPNSTAIFDHAKKNPKYHAIALEHIKSLDNESLNRLNKKIVMFADGATPQVIEELNSLVLRLDVSNTDFDPNCLLFKVLATSGYINTISKFAANNIYCKRFVQILMPNLIKEKPEIALTIALNAKKFPNLNQDLRPYNIPKLITDCVAAQHYEIAYQAAAKIKFGKDELTKNFDQANELVRMLNETKNDEVIASCILLTLIPYALYADWAEKVTVPETTSQMMQSDTTIVASRALAFAAAMTQSPIMARIMATPLNLAAASRFFDSGNIPFIYIAVRFFAAIAPYMKVGDQVEEAVTKEIELANEYSDNVRLVIIIIQSFLLIPKTEWGTLMTKLPIQDFITKMESRFSANPDVMGPLGALRNHQ
ncbi:hypothetical protein TRFO_09657 [Tritrichomonas foetus]|uniref:Protein kinase domain-containing protein n=1 Tax=Tritrichomonas foetus TaxID=1144522 RepID=A0A1J4JD26_9EUKA|nr:hypothetical protein TRFO_09657 [Tritrichomonas foetus]|eukprot:OHS97094.1 hypothetical protein TRFO_09657 [Tritrichomonas foetus]